VVAGGGRGGAPVVAVAARDEAAGESDGRGGERTRYGS
jgi:hypothetical protein